ncbi:hypothetical protein [Streptomyces altiplanensis]
MGSGSGRGLAGVRERVGLLRLRGRFTAGPRPGWRARVVIIAYETGLAPPR